ncbi:hypothetical protein LCGC14_2608420 [marine sediment metagenome]|uniref:Uncharacterized protein n=1 Tax=marine sediment metagenome TaxID=412755 RepID=A0A0F9CHQ4_9ZZZZ
MTNIKDVMESIQKEKLKLCNEIWANLGKLYIAEDRIVEIFLKNLEKINAEGGCEALNF